MTPARDMSMPLNHGTNRSVQLQAQLRAGSRIRGAKWHSRYRAAVMLAPKRHDFATIALCGAATRERQEKARMKRAKELEAKKS